MADDKTPNEKPAAGNANKADKTPNEKPALPKTDFAIGESTGNLTRDAIIEQVRGKHLADGKSEEEAQKLALKRAFQMIA